MSWFLWLALSMSGAASPLSLSCTVEGGAKAGLDPKAVCAQFVERLSRESGRSYALVPVEKRAGNGMTVAIRFVGRDTVAAAATVIAGGRKRVLETRMISSSDRALGLDSIGVLARDVAQAAARSD